MADSNKKKYIKYEDTTYILEDSRLPDPTGFDNKVLGVDNGAYVLKQEEGGGGSGPEVILVTIDDSTDPATASMTASEIRSAANGNIVRMNYYAVHDYVGIVEGKAVFSAVVGPDVSCVFVANNGAVEFWSKTIPTVPQMANQLDMSDWTAGKTVDAAVLATDLEAAGRALSAKYTKPSGGIPASDLAAGVIPTVPQMADDYVLEGMDDWTAGKTVDAATLKNAMNVISQGIGSKANASDIPTKTSDLTNDSGYQTATQVQTAIAAAAELPTGGSTGDFLRKTANGVAWATVPSAESNSFGGGA